MQGFEYCHNFSEGLHLTAKWSCTTLYPKVRALLCHERKITNLTKFHSRVWHKVLPSRELATVTMTTVPFAKKQHLGKLDRMRIVIFLTHHDSNGSMPKILAMWMKEDSRAGRELKSLSLSQSVLVKWRTLSKQEDSNFLWGKVLSSVTAKCSSEFHRVSFPSSRAPWLERLHRSLKWFHPFKQFSLSWRQINQHWALTARSCFSKTRYSLYTRQAVLHREFSPWTSSAVQTVLWISM